MGWPIEDHERPHLEALGAELHRLRAGRPMWLIASRAELSERQVGNIERARSRTRRSTLTRLVHAVMPNADEVQAAAMLEQLVALAGPALAAESVIADRQERARARRRRRREREQQALCNPRALSSGPADDEDKGEPS